MAQAAEKQAEQVIVPDVAVRRFEVPDIDRHGAWLGTRILRAFKHLDQRSIRGFLQGLVYNNEACFLYQDNAVGLAQADRAWSLNPRTVIRERFVFCRDPDNQQHVLEAAALYTEFARWGRAIGAETMVVEELSDVPDSLVRSAIKGRFGIRNETFVRLDRE
jgi:hypothetical protein